MNCNFFKFFFFQAASLILFSYLFVGCSSSRSSNDFTSLENAANDQVIYSFKGRVIDGPVNGSTCFIDMNEDNIQSDNEPVTVTDEFGNYNFEYTNIDENLTISSKQVICLGGIDIDTNQPVTIPLKARLPDMSSSNQKIVITPITTLLSSAENIREKEAMLSAIGIDINELTDIDLISTDFYELSKSADSQINTLFVKKMVRKQNQVSSTIKNVFEGLKKDDQSVDFQLKNLIIDEMGNLAKTSYTTAGEANVLSNVLINQSFIQSLSLNSVAVFNQLFLNNEIIIDVQKLGKISNQLAEFNKQFDQCNLQTSECVDVLKLSQESLGNLIGDYMNPETSVTESSFDLAVSTVISSVSAECDPLLVCATVLTCIDGVEYPTSCGSSNCDAPLGVCARCLSSEYESTELLNVDDVECHPLTTCLSTEYEAIAATPTTDRVCMPLRTCSDSQFEIEAPTATSDRMCMPLRTCSDSQFETEAPTATSDRMCVPLSTCSDTQFESQAPTAISDRVCMPLSTCSDTQFESQAPTTTADRVCTPLSTCSDTQFESQTPTATADRVCTPLSTCSDTQFESEPPTASSDRVCTPLTDCLHTEYESVAPTLTSDRVCVPFTGCLNTEYKSELLMQNMVIRYCEPLTVCSNSEYEIVSATLTTDRECASLTQCLTTEYETIAATLTSDRECMPLTTCLSTEYESVAATPTTDRECMPLTTCLSTEYESVVATPTTDRECTPLTTCLSTEYELVAPTSSSDRVCQFYSTCNNGYQLTGQTSNFAGNCVDIDECFLNIDNCDPNASCTNMEGSFSCHCDTGFSGDGFNCSDINECEANNGGCDEYAICTNMEGSFSCHCDTGFSGDGLICTNIDDCTSNPCQNNGTCTEGLNSYTCSCPDGYTGTNCEDVAILPTNAALFADGTASCNAGYSGDISWDGSSWTGFCTDINECALGSDNCDTNASCTNTEGGFSCHCDAGFSGDGVSCTSSIPADLLGVWSPYSIKVGPSMDSGSWWELSATDKAARSCWTDDSFEFKADGSLTIDLGNETWVEAWQDGLNEGCRSPVPPHISKDVYFEYITASPRNKIKVTGTGGYLALSKAINGSELTNSQQAPNQITYDILEHQPGGYLKLSIQTGSSYWTVELTKGAYVPAAPTEVDVTFKVNMSQTSLTDSQLYPNPVLRIHGEWGWGNGVGLTDSDGDNIWEGTVRLMSNRSYLYHVIVDSDNLDVKFNQCAQQTSVDFHTQTTDGVIQSTQVIAPQDCTPLAVQFSVDMSAINYDRTRYPGVRIHGSWNWEQGVHLTDSNQDDRWEGVARIPAFQSVLYHVIAVPEDNTLPQIKFNQCGTPNTDYTIQMGGFNSVNDQSIVAVECGAIINAQIDLSASIFPNLDYAHVSLQTVKNINGVWAEFPAISLADADKDGVFTGRSEITASQYESSTNQYHYYIKIAGSGDDLKIYSDSATTPFMAPLINHAEIGSETTVSQVIGDAYFETDYKRATYVQKCDTSQLGSPDFSEDFSDSSLNTAVWNTDIGRGDWGWGNGEWQSYQAANIDLQSGNLVITAKNDTSLTDDWGGKKISSGKIHTKNKKGWTYGTFIIRAKLPYSNLTWPAIWLMPTPDPANPPHGFYGVWPASGEIDIMENFGFKGHHIEQTLHNNTYNFSSGQGGWGKGMHVSDISQFNDYKLIWEENAITFCINDTFNHVYKKPVTLNDYNKWPYDKEFYLILNLAIGSSWWESAGNLVQPLDLSSLDQGESFHIDSIKVWDSP